MTAVLLSFSVLVAQALPGAGPGMTTKELIAVGCALLMVIVVGVLLRLHSK
jgi:hypothetical protein